TVNGILLQTNAAAAGEAAQGQSSITATTVAARPSDVSSDAGTQSVASPQSKSTFELPAATVGPLSLRMAAAQGDVSAEFEVASRLA
ncbi:hypothetical protein ABTO80_18495, partial [Acinetobacter baumannii]